MQKQNKFAFPEKCNTFVSPKRWILNNPHQIGPFVYRLGRKIFILVRGVRLPYGLPILSRVIIRSEMVGFFFPISFIVYYCVGVTSARPEVELM